MNSDSPMNKDLFTKATKALALRNYDATIFWMLQLLSQEPECWDARQLARRAAHERWKESAFTGRGAYFLRLWIRMKRFFKIAQATYCFQKKDHSKALMIAESILSEFPYDERAHQLVIKVAKECHPRFCREGLYSFETLFQTKCSNSRQIKLLEEGAAFCLFSEKGKKPWNACKAKEFYEELLAIDPKNFKARKGMNKAFAALLVK